MAPTTSRILVAFGLAPVAAAGVVAAERVAQVAAVVRVGLAAGAGVVVRAGAGGPRLLLAAQWAMDAYDLLVDDPAYECSPSSLSRTWANPTPMEIEQQEDRVILRHEFMDVVRTIYVDGRDLAADVPLNVVGHSIGRYEGSTLVIETRSFSPSVISTVSGLPQTPTLQTVERLTLSDDGQTFQHELTHEDPATLTAPWTSRRAYRRAPGLAPLLAFDCVLEDAGYEEDAGDPSN